MRPRKRNQLPEKKGKLDSIIDVKEAAHEKEGSESGDAYSFDSDKDAQRMEAELIVKLQEDTPENYNKGTYKHFKGATIDIDSATQTL